MTKTKDNSYFLTKGWLDNKTFKGTVSVVYIPLGCRKHLYVVQSFIVLPVFILLRTSLRAAIIIFQLSPLEKKALAPDVSHYLRQ